MRRIQSAILTVVSLALSSILFINPAHGAASPGVAVVKNGLIMYFDAANPIALSGSTLRDLSGNGYNGTITAVSGNPNLALTNGKFLNFTANGGFVDLPDIADGVLFSNMTVTFYANFGDANNNERIIDFAIGPGVDNLVIARELTGNNIYIEQSGNGRCTATNAITNNQWSHWAFSIYGQRCFIYRDNVELLNTAYLTNSYTGGSRVNNFIGKSNTSGNAFFEGAIADLAAYSRGLNTPELTNNYLVQTDLVAPVIATTSISTPEQSTTVATLDTGEATTFTLLPTGDFARFTLSASGELVFNSPPNFAAPTDLDGNNRYELTVRVMDSRGNFDDVAVQVSVTDIPDFATISTPTLNTAAIKGRPLTISVLPGVGVGSGKLTYLIGKKRIPGCINQLYSGSGTAICTFKPALRGPQEITVTFTPTSLIYTAVSSQLKFAVGRRTATR